MGEWVSNPRGSLLTAALVGFVWLWPTTAVRADGDASPGEGSIVLSANVIRTWEDRGLQFLLMQGDCRILQGDRRVQCAECLAWAPAQRGEANETVRFHFVARRRVELELPGKPRESLERYTSAWTTTQGFVAKAAQEVAQGSGAEHPLYRHVIDTQDPFRDVPREDPAIQRTLFQEPAQEANPPAGRIRAPRRGGGPFLPTPSRGPNTRRFLSLAPRSSRTYQLETMTGAAGEEMATISGGVTLTVEEPDTGNMVTIATDRAVVWRRGEATAIPGDTRHDVSAQQIETYLEGNVQINIGSAADFSRNQQIQLNGKQIYFDVNRNRALVLDGTIETYDERLRAPLLMNSERLFMFAPDKFYGESSSFTTSPYRGRPGYAFTGDETYLERVKQPIVNPFTGNPALDTQGKPMFRSKNFGTSYNSFLRVDDVPIFYTPYVRVDLEHPLGPVETIKFGNTQRLGVTTSVTLNAWRLLGLDYLEVADRFDWLFDVGYYSARGVAGGTRVTYVGKEPPLTAGAYHGRFLTWWIDDHGRDFLGVGRNDLVPPETFRGRALFQHRHQLDDDTSLIASFAYLSDKNFLQSFFQNDFDIAPDQETVLYLKRQRENLAWTFLAMPRVNDFLPQNEALPRGDVYLIGQSLLDDRLTYYSHSSIGYFRVRPPAEEPLLGSPTFDATADTARVDTRHELDLPFRLGDLNVVPYAIGQFTGYTEAVDGEMLGRGYGAGGVRASLPFWRTFPNIQSTLFNLNGLAHKITLYADYQYALSTHPREELPYIDQLDDDTSDLVRRMNLYRTYTAQGLPVPERYDPRFEGFRRDLDFYPEAIDSLHVVRLGVSQRLQTKRGPIGAEKIIDWMTYDLRGSYFPDSDRDNLGKPFGLLDYNYRWHIGDRTSVLSTGVWEPLDGTNTQSVTLAMQRPPRSLLSAFYSHYVSGPFESNFVGFNSSYRFSYKYAGYIATSVDLSQLNQVSYQFGFTRIGLDFITHLTVNYTAGREDFGFRFEILPRVAPRRAFGRGVLTTLPYGVEAGELIAPVSLDRIGILQNNTSQPF
jgi:hypothetical protein